MALRTHELHPMLVHFPLTLVPAALAFDAIGRYTNSQALMDVGKVMMPFAAASASSERAIAGVDQGVAAVAHSGVSRLRTDYTQHLFNEAGQVSLQPAHRG